MSPLQNKKEGFKELIEFPTKHLFKIVGENSESFRSSIYKMFDLSEINILSIDEKSSSKGSYVSYSVNVHIKTVQELESYYLKISKLPNIKFYL